MADLGTSGPLIASLLQAQRQEENPFQTQRKYGRELIVKGSSTAPLQSGNWLEGLARALQAGVGGYFSGEANRDEEAQTQNNIGVYSNAYKKALGDPQNNIAPDPQGALETLKGLKGGGAQREALIGQLLQGGINNAVANQTATGALNRRYPGVPGGGLNIDITKPNISAAPGYQGTLASRESGNNPQAINPQSGAFGTYQFMPQTAADVRQANPQLNLPEDHRTWTPDQQNQAEQALRGMNNKRLGELGIPVTPATLALAHATGADGTAKLLSTPPNTPMEQAVPASWIQQNPNMQGKTVGQYVNGFAQFNQGQQGAQPATPQAGPQVAQAAPTAPAPAMAPVPQIQPSPEAARTRAEAQSLRQSDPVKALQLYERADQEESKWITDRAAKASDISMQGTEHDRQQATATPNSEQSLSAGFSDRMANSERLIRQFGSALTSGSAKAKDMVPFGIGNFAQTPEYQQAKQARDDFINAQLRRESGAAIAPTEYTNADRQYFPQPGDGPDVIAQKERNRQLAIEGMVRNAGPAYQPSPTVRAPQTGGGNSELLNQAREAIKAGKSKEEVIRVLREHGGDPGQL